MDSQASGSESVCFQLISYRQALILGNPASVSQSFFLQRHPTWHHESCQGVCKLHTGSGLQIAIPNGVAQGAESFTHQMRSHLGWEPCLLFKTQVKPIEKPFKQFKKSFSKLLRINQFNWKNTNSLIRNNLGIHG